MKILVGIPCLLGASFICEAIESVLNNSKDVDLLLIDNGADQETKELISIYEIRDNVHVIRNERNIYVNPAWNQIMEFFLKRDYDILAIMNSDVVLTNGWDTFLLNQFLADGHTIIPVPTITENTFVNVTNTSHEITETGIPGIFIVLTQEQAKKVYPIPYGIQIWFGDNWIYETLRGCGYQTAIYKNLKVYHSLSQTISRVPEAVEIIEQDKKYWNEKGIIQRDYLIEKYKA